ncbi:hypothetical protein [Candidatus Amarolinea aalborgensis]|uniref:hypothetical protein n=1 Tax=Candidatus Amarolinea aalborgensis TaxID=2249329 RepID=UPI003BF9921F
MTRKLSGPLAEQAQVVESPALTSAGATPMLFHARMKPPSANARADWGTWDEGGRRRPRQTRCGLSTLTVDLEEWFQA